MKAGLKTGAAVIISAIMAILSLGALSGCNDTPLEEISEETVVQEVGDFIQLEAVDSFHKKIVNGAGMSGSDGRIHLHSSSSGDMVLDEFSVFVFDIGHIEKLGELYVWNYNAAGQTDNGLKEITVSVSEDNLAYADIGDFTLALASGEEGIEATNLVDGGSIDFSGISARYIRIVANSNYGGSGYGLSEIRLFRYKQPIREGESISASPIERYVNGKWSATAEDYNLTNGVGLSDSLSATAVHDNDPGHMVTDTPDAIGFVLDLKGQYPVSQLVIWNYNDPEHLDYGLQDIRIRISDDGTTWKTVDSYTLPQGTGEDEMPASLTVDLENVHTHYIQIEIYSNYGGEKVGLSAATAFLGEGWYCDSASDYTAMLSSYSGWAGADGIYSVNLDGKDYDYDRNVEEQKTFFVFSDTIISEVDPVTRLRTSSYMPNNTSAILTGGKASAKNLEFFYPEKSSQCANILPDPAEASTANASKNLYYWLGDTFVIKNKLYIYCLKIDTVDPSVTGYSFAQIGVDLARYDIVDGEVDFSSLTIINDTEGRLCDVSDSLNEWYFGGAVFQSTENAGVLNPDGYVYIYGYNDVNNLGRELIVARVKEDEIENFSAYEYLGENGNWSSEIPTTFSYLADDVAPELSVTQIQTGEYAGQYVLVNSHITNTPTIKASISSSPYDCFENKTTVFSYDDCASLLGSGNNTYNAKAHPALSSSNELLISYNINGDDCYTYADIYRPRFVRLAMVAGVQEEL